MSVPTDNYISVKEYNKISKYKYLEIEIEKTRHLIVPLLVGALGMIKKGTDKHINKIADSSSLNEIQKKIALSGIAHLMRRVRTKQPKNITQKRQQNA